MTNHTILLIQTSPGQSSRTFYDFPNEAEAMDQIAGLYEIRLAKENPNVDQVQYRAEDLFRFIDSHQDFVALIFDPTTLQYTPRNKEWIKDRLIAHFSGQQPPPQQNPYTNQSLFNNNNKHRNRRR